MTAIARLAAAVLGAWILIGFDQIGGAQEGDPPEAAAPSERIIFIGTGPVVGIYYPAGGAICRMVNDRRARHGLRCAVESTDGSVENLEALRRGELDLAIVQSDWQYRAYEGKAPFEADGAFEDLRSIFAIHAEPVTVVAAADAGIETLSDLEGKRINIGPAGSGQQAMARAMIAALGWKLDDFAAVSEVDPNEESAALCADAFDAFILPIGYPNGAIQEAIDGCDAVLIDVVGPGIERLIAETPYFARSVIPTGSYVGVPEDVVTFGVKATLVASTRLDEEAVYQVVKSVFDDLERFKAMHPAFVALTPEAMIGDGNTAPLHPGALRYYKERGWR